MATTTVLNGPTQTSEVHAVSFEITNGASSEAPKKVRRSLPALTDIERLRQALKGTQAKALLPTDEGYEQALRCWSRAAEKPAGVAAIPTTTEEVAIIVKFATEGGFEMAVKGGGHSSAGTSCTDGGILIDLSSMRNVRVEPEEKRLYVQGGCIWGDVDKAAYKHGIATVGGTVSHTGVGGLTLGGGYGVLSGKYGLTIDNVLGATVVLASGEIVKASDEENQELFWGLLGAGQNFGVTTEFILQGYPQTDIFMGMMGFLPTPSNIEKVVAATNNLYEFKETASGMRSKSGGLTNTVMGYAKPPPAGGKTLMLVVTAFMGSEADGREMLSEYYAIGPVMNNMRMAPYPEVNNLLPAHTGFRCSVKSAGFTLPLSPKFVSDQMHLYDQFIADCPDAVRTVVAWEFLDPTKIVASDRGCFANRGYHLNTIIMPMWTQADNDSTCREWARTVSEKFKDELQTHGFETGVGVEGGAGVRGEKGAVLMYGNYDQTDERCKDVFGVNYERLQGVKAAFDPQNHFNKLFAITPAKA